MRVWIAIKVSKYLRNVLFQWRKWVSLRVRRELMNIRLWHSIIWLDIWQNTIHSYIAYIFFKTNVPPFDRLAVRDHKVIAPGWEQDLNESLVSRGKEPFLELVFKRFTSSIVVCRSSTVKSLAFEIRVKRNVELVIQRWLAKKKKSTFIQHIIGSHSLSLETIFFFGYLKRSEDLKF